MRFARFLLERAADYCAAVDLLRDVVLDDAEHEEANARLAYLYERLGEDARLAEILDRRDTFSLNAATWRAWRARLNWSRSSTRERPDEAVEVLGWALDPTPRTAGAGRRAAGTADARRRRGLPPRCRIGADPATAAGGGADGA